jgi:hypothetical protein
MGRPFLECVRRRGRVRAGAECGVCAHVRGHIYFDAHTVFGPSSAFAFSLPFAPHSVAFFVLKGV